MKSLYALSLLTALSGTACVGLEDLSNGSSGNGGVATAQGPSWLVGTWLDPYGKRMDLNADGSIEATHEPDGTWSSDGVFFSINGEEARQIRVTSGCRYMTLGVSDRIYAKQGDIVGCPTAPEPLSADEQQLAGNYGLFPDYYDIDWTISGSLTLGADRSATLSYHRNHHSVTSSYASMTWDRYVHHGEWAWSDEDGGTLHIKLPWGGGVDFALSTGWGGTPTLCDNYACGRLIREN